MNYNLQACDSLYLLNKSIHMIFHTALSTNHWRVFQLDRLSYKNRLQPDYCDLPHVAFFMATYVRLSFLAACH